MKAVLRQRWSIFLSLGVLAGAALLPLSAARAGFEWTPPAAAPRSGPVVDAMPVPDVDIMPPIDSEPMMMPDMTDAPGIAAIDARPLAPPPVTTAPVSDDRDYAVAEGFGRDIPLALVMQQIVPPGYAYSFDPAVNPGTRVSWDGGRPWNRVLSDAVAPFGLEAVVIDMTVHVREASAQQAMAAPSSLQTVPPQTSMMSEIARAAGATPTGMIRADAGPVDFPAPAAAAETPEIITDPSRLAEIGRSGAATYSPSYPRHVPVMKQPHPVTPSVATPATPVPVPQPETITFNSPRANTAPQSASSLQPEENPFAAQAPTPITPAESSIVPPPRVFSEPAAPATDSPAPSVLDPHAVGSWRAEKDASLKDTLSAWCEQAGVRLYWDAAGDYTMPVAVRASGTFPEVLMQTLSAYGDAGDRPVGALHPNLPDGPSVLIIRGSADTAAVN